MRRLLAFLLCLLLPAPAPAGSPPAGDAWTVCRQAIAAAEPGSGLPPGLLLAIALVETGRARPDGRLDPWPWSLNVEGESRSFASRAAAVAETEALLAAGRRSIDIGCMQINLLHHPNAFASPAEGFEPTANIRYAIGFLRRLQARHGSWEAAIGAYHSADPARGGAYHRKVALARLSSAWSGGGIVPLPAQPALAGLCAAGFRPALRFLPPLRRPRLTCTRA